jgi:hypothetical protein
MKTVLITGCSSGYGLETARHFHAQGWNVVATMRTPREDILPRSERLRVLPLDVTRPASIAAAIEACGPVDVLVNNAGVGVVGVFEATPMATVRELFETNTFGVMAMTQAVVPQLRARRSGVVVNVTSIVTLTPMPLAAAYNGQQDGYRRGHRIASVRARGVQRAGQTCRAWLRPDHALCEQRRIAHGRALSRGIRGFREPDPRFICAGDHGDDGVRRGRGGVPCRERCVRAASISSGSRRSRARSVESLSIARNGVFADTAAVIVKGVGRTAQTDVLQQFHVPRSGRHEHNGHHGHKGEAALLLPWCLGVLVLTELATNNREPL